MCIMHVLLYTYMCTCMHVMLESMSIDGATAGQWRMTNATLHTYVKTYIHTYIHIYMSRWMQGKTCSMREHLSVCVHNFIHICLCAYIHTRTHTHNTYMYTYPLDLFQLFKSPDLDIHTCLRAYICAHTQYIHVRIPAWSVPALQEAQQLIVIGSTNFYKSPLTQPSLFETHLGQPEQCMHACKMSGFMRMWVSTNSGYALRGPSGVAWVVHACMYDVRVYAYVSLY
jgi:hypothetical protein